MMVLSGKPDSDKTHRGRYGTDGRKSQVAGSHLSGRTWARLRPPCSDAGCLVNSEQPVLEGVQLRPDNLGQGCSERESTFRHAEGWDVNR